MKAYFFTYTRQGIHTCQKIKASLESQWNCSIFAPERFSVEGIKFLNRDSRKIIRDLWRQADAFIFVAATGIAVRNIAPLIKDKTVDPAVVCVDVAGKYAISLLSGHIGGGNRLTKQIAQAIGALPIITTATDINRRFAVDEWAQEQGYVISSMQIAKEISAAILERDIPIQAEVPISGALPVGLIVADKGPIGISFSVYAHEPYPRTLRLIPKVLTLGIGCRKGATAAQIENAVKTTFHAHGLDVRAIQQVASIDIKKEEAGLLSFCESWGLPLTFYSAEQLSSLSGEFTASTFVKQTTGVDNICERTAMMHGDKLLIPKTGVNGVTVAVATKKWEVQF